MIWTYSDDDVRGESWLIILLKSFKMKILLSSSTSQISTSILSWCWTACRYHRSSARTQTGVRCSDYPPDSRRNSGGGSAIFLLAPEQVGRGRNHDDLFHPAVSLRAKRYVYLPVASSCRGFARGGQLVGADQGSANCNMFDVPREDC